MINPKLVAALLCSIFLGTFCFGQDAPFVTTTLSKPTDIPANGWNKTLLLRNGRTFVLHLAGSEKMMVKVFDTAHREVVSVRQLFKVISEGDLPESAVHGLYDIDGWPTLFVSQLINNEHGLVRVRFNPNDGSIYDEIIMCSSKKELFYLSKSKNSDNYAILNYRHINENATDRGLRVTFWNGKHVKVQEAVFSMPNLVITNSWPVSFFYDDELGTFLSVATQTVTKKGDHEEYLIAGGLQPSDTAFNTSIAKLPTAFIPSGGSFQYNAFDGTVNLTIIGSVWEVNQNSYHNQQIRSYVSFFAVYDKQNMEPRHVKQIFNKSCNEYFQRQTASTRDYVGVPKAMFTNKFGVTYLMCGNNINEDQRIDGKRVTYPGIGLTRLNDAGEETGGLVLPRGKYSRFASDHERLVNASVGSVRYIPIEKNNFLFFNDHPENFSLELKDSVRTVKANCSGEAMCYKVTSRDEVSKQFLLGQPNAGEARWMMMGSIDAQPKLGLMSSLICVTKGKEDHIYVAWSKIGD